MTTARPAARRTALITRTGIALAVAAALVACSSDDTETADPAGSSDETSSEASAPADGDTDAQEAPAAGDTDAFCEAYDENGGTGATVGPVQLWLPKEDLAADLSSRLTAMGDLEPPAEVSDAWAASKTYYTDLQATVDALPAGGIIDDPAVYASNPEMEESFSTVTDWYFDTCQ